MAKILAFTRNRSDVRRRDQQLQSQGTGASGNYTLEQTVEAGAAGQVLVSVVVPTRGRPHLLSRCLAGLILQHFDATRFEIIVVDDTPDPVTQEVVRNWAEHAAGTGPAIIYIPSHGAHGAAAARNLGWQAASGDIVAFTDDDAVARSDWLRKGLDAFHDNIDAVRGRIMMPLNRKPTDYELDAKALEQAEFATANCFCRKSALDMLGGFDERFRTTGREDADLYFRLLRTKARIAYAPAAVIVHPIRPARWGVSLSQQRRILSDALLYKKHPSLYREKIRAAPRWDYYFIVLALLISLYGLGARLMALAMVAGGIWLALTLQLCVMRLRHTVRTPAHVGEMLVTSLLIPPLAVFWHLVGAVRFRARLV